MITTTLIRRKRGYNESPTTGGTVTVTIRDSGSSVLIETDDEYYLTRTAANGEYKIIAKTNNMKPVFFREKKQVFCARSDRTMINMKKFRLKRF